MERGNTLTRAAVAALRSRSGQMEHWLNWETKSNRDRHFAAGMKCNLKQIEAESERRSSSQRSIRFKSGLPLVFRLSLLLHSHRVESRFASYRLGLEKREDSTSEERIYLHSSLSCWELRQTGVRGRAEGDAGDAKGTSDAWPLKRLRCARCCRTT